MVNAISLWLDCVPRNTRSGECALLDGPAKELGPNHEGEVNGGQASKRKVREGQQYLEVYDRIGEMYMSNWRSTLRALSSPRSMGMDLERRHLAHGSEGADGEGHGAVMALEGQIAELLMDEPLGRGLAAREVCAVYFLVPVAHERVVLMVTEYLGGIAMVEAARDAWLLAYEGTWRLSEHKQALEAAIEQRNTVEVDWRRAVDQDGLGD